MTEVAGFQQPSTTDSEYNSLVFVIQSLLRKLQTVTLVRVVAVSNEGGVSPVGTVDVQPLVNQRTGNNESVPHGVIYGVPYFRLQGGGNAVILDPQVGDLGMAAFASRDISAVKVQKGPAPPGSFRTFDWADALYFGGLLNGAPTQYVRFHAAGIELKAPTVTVTGNLVVTGTAVAGSPAISLTEHVHGGVSAGGAQTSPPVP